MCRCVEIPDSSHTILIIVSLQRTWCADRDTLLDFVAFRLLELQFSNSLLLCYYKANVRFIFSIQERIFEICRMARIPITFSDLECDFNCPRITYQDSEKRDGYSMSYQYTEGLLKVCLFLFSHWCCTRNGVWYITPFLMISWVTSEVILGQLASLMANWPYLIAHFCSQRTRVLQ